MSALPIYAVLPDVLEALRSQGTAVLIAPPGAGKTTAVAPAMLNEGWCSDSVILLSPRRVAARAAAERMAEMLGEKPGETIGYLSRLDSKQSSKTRVLVMTEAIFVNRIVKDPELAGVSAIVFDEAHERHLDSDLGLALALESKAIVREDLRLCVMSATIDGHRFGQLLGTDTAIIESEGVAHPLRIEWLGGRPEIRIEEQMADAVTTAWQAEEGDILAFLPGVREIERVRERLHTRFPGIPIHSLHGQADPASQRAALRPDPRGRRRIILATAIAETSLTLDGVSVVIDSGLSRKAEFDRAAGTTRLVTVRSSQAAAAQRAGRAARQGPGVAYRLWTAAGHAGRPVFDPPDIETADLAGLILCLAQWGTQDVHSLAWLDAPPAAAIASAQDRLRTLGALDQAGTITDWGDKIARLPMSPVHAAIVLLGAQVQDALLAAQLVLLLQERALGGRGEDVMARLSQWRDGRSKRADASAKLAQRWAQQASTLVGISGPEISGPKISNPAVFLAQAMPDNIAQRRDRSGEHWISAGGRGYWLDPASPLSRAEWLIIGDAQGHAQGARITAAAALEPEDVDRHLAHLIDRRALLNWNRADNRVEARIERRLGAITLTSGPDPDPDETAIMDMLMDKAVQQMETIVPPALVARGKFAGLAALSLDALKDSAALWLAPILAGQRALPLDQMQLTHAALSMLDWNDRQSLDQLAPKEFVSPAGTHHTIDYISDNAPSVELRVQALFGLQQHPVIGTEPLLLTLTSPAGRPIQATRDLPAFWKGSWQDVRKDMKGRYPKHRWPEEPWSERPSLKTKKAFSHTDS